MWMALSRLCWCAGLSEHSLEKVPKSNELAYLLFLSFAVCGFKIGSQNGCIGSYIVSIKVIVIIQICENKTFGVTNAEKF